MKIQAKCPYCNKLQDWTFKKPFGYYFAEICNNCNKPVEITEIKQEEKK